MIDLIDRDALISAIEDTDWYHVSDNGELVAGANSLKHTPLYKSDDVFNAIFDAPSVSTSHWQWIPVTERMPDSQEDVLVVAFWHERWQTMIGWNSDYGKKWRVITPHGEREPGGVTHWMPLPEPPDVGEKVGDAV